MPGEQRSLYFTYVTWPFSMTVQQPDSRQSSPLYATYHTKGPPCSWRPLNSCSFSWIRIKYHIGIADCTQQPWKLPRSSDFASIRRNRKMSGSSIPENGELWINSCVMTLCSSGRLLSSDLCTSFSIIACTFPVTLLSTLSKVEVFRKL